MAPVPNQGRSPADPLGVGALCTRVLVTVRADNSIVDAARCMRREHVGCVVVIDWHAQGERPVGLLTDRDIVMSVVAVGIDPNVLTVGDVMTQDLVTAREDDSLGRALTLMRERGVRRLPVVSDEGWLVGLLSFDDLVAAVTLQTQALTEALVVGRLREGDAHP